MQSGPQWAEINYNYIKITFTQKVGPEQEYEEYKKTYTIEELKKWFTITPATIHLALAYTGKGITSSEEYLYGMPTEWKIENITNILKEKLSDLDQLREDILSKGNERFEMNQTTKLGASTNFTYIQHILGGNNSKYENSTKYNRSSAQCGLLLKTYQSDIFTNWINSEWIDGVVS